MDRTQQSMLHDLLFSHRLIMAPSLPTVCVRHCAPALCLAGTSHEYVLPHAMTVHKEIRSVLRDMLVVRMDLEVLLNMKIQISNFDLEFNEGGSLRTKCRRLSLFVLRPDCLPDFVPLQGMPKMVTTCIEAFSQILPSTKSALQHVTSLFKQEIGGRSHEDQILHSQFFQVRVKCDEKLPICLLLHSLSSLTLAALTAWMYQKPLLLLSVAISHVQSESLFVICSFCSQ